jgi:hypothetical protein
MSALDELLSQWRSNPDADATIALCSFLGTSSREELIREVATSAETWHTEDGRVMLAVGRMHLDAGLLAEAQAALVAAGKANGRDAAPRKCSRVRSSLTPTTARRASGTTDPSSTARFKSESASKR